MAYESGGSGLWSTLDDYLKFAKLFLGDGAVDGGRLLCTETLARMMTNQLTYSQRVSSAWLGRRPFAVAVGSDSACRWFWRPTTRTGCGVGASGRLVGPELMEAGGKPTPNDGSIFIFLAHNMVDLEQMAAGIGLGVWMAIDDYQKAAFAP